jgi:hypothetical protein
MARNWYLSLAESSDLIHQTIMAWADHDIDRLQVKLKQLREFGSWLEEQLDREQVEQLLSPSDYATGLDDVLYVRHWQRQLDEVRLWTGFIHDEMAAAVMA